MKLSIKLIVIIVWGVSVAVVFLSYFMLSPSNEFVQKSIDSGISGLSAQTAVRLTISMAVGIVTASFLIWLLIDRLVVKPISNINETIRIIAAGNLGKQIDFKSDDEIGELVKNINIMIKNLAVAFQSMANSLRTSKEEETALSINVKELEEARRATLKLLGELNMEKAKLEEAKAKDEALLLGIGDGVVAANAFGSIIFANKAAEILLGFTISEILGKKWDEIILAIGDKDNKVLPSNEQPVTKVLSTGKKVNITCYLTKKGGTRFPVAVTASPVIINERISGIVVVFRDITREKEIDKMKTEFISLASHQLRTPLSAIRWFTELLSDETSGKLTSQQREIAENIRGSADRMNELVEALLNISRIESGRIIIDPKPTDLGQLIKEVNNDLSAKLEEKQHRLVINVQDQLPKISIDPKLIRQAYMNLLTNAIKYTPKGGEITVAISKKGDEIVSQISDNGCGIPAREQTKVFQKFFRADNVVKLEPEGSGLGLYLVKAVVESSKGRVWFQSEEGKGTTFWFSLPLSGTPPKEGEVELNS